MIEYARLNGNLPVIIDDRRARRVAERLGLKVHGTIGIVAAATSAENFTKAFRDNVLSLRTAGLYTMVRDHTAVNEKAIALAKKLGVTPAASQTSKSLESNGKAELAKLKALTASEFDTAYVANEVGYHEAVIDLLDKKLIPNAKIA